MFEFTMVNENQRDLARVLTTMSKDRWEVEHVHSQMSTEDDYGVIWYNVLMKRKIQGETTLSVMHGE